jgi:hypothetical protein
MTKEKSGKFVLELFEDDPGVAILRLPTYPKEGNIKTSKSLRLYDLIGEYKGPDIYLDFDIYGELVKIDIDGEF